MQTYSCHINFYARYIFMYNFSKQSNKIQKATKYSLLLVLKPFFMEPYMAPHVVHVEAFE